MTPPVPPAQPSPAPPPPSPLLKPLTSIHCAPNTFPANCRLSPPPLGSHHFHHLQPSSRLGPSRRGRICAPIESSASWQVGSSAAAFAVPVFPGPRLHPHHPSGRTGRGAGLEKLSPPEGVGAPGADTHAGVSARSHPRALSAPPPGGVGERALAVASAAGAAALQRPALVPGWPRASRPDAARSLYTTPLERARAYVKPGGGPQPMARQLEPGPKLGGRTRGQSRPGEPGEPGGGRGASPR